MPTINKRFLLVLLLITAALAGSLVGAHTVQADRIPDALKGQADRAVEQGKPDAAVHYLRQYLEFRPDDTDARERFAGLLKDRDGADPSDLLLLYDKVLRADPSRHALRRDALAASLRLGRYTDAEAHAEALLKDSPTDAELWQKLAAAQAGLQKTTEARASYEAAIKHKPTDPLPYQRLAQYLWKDLKQPQEARAVVERLVAAAPTDPEAYLTRARFDLFAGDGTRAAGDLRKALDLDPKNAEALLLIADQHQKGRDLTAARDRLAEGARLYPQDVRFVRSLAWLELNRSNVGAAVGVLEDGMTRVKDAFDLLVPLADLLVQLGETGRTEDIIRKLEAKPSPTSRMQVKYLRARLAMRAADWAGAVALLGELRTEAVNLPGLENQTNLLLAACHNRQADSAREQETLKLLLNKDPNHVAGRVALAQSYLNAGRTADAIREYAQAVQSPYASPVTHATLLKLKARELKFTGGRPDEWKHLERVAGELAKAYNPASSDPVLVRADLADCRGEYQQSAALLKAEAARRPGDARLWAALADRIADLGGVAVGLGVLDEAQAAAGDGADLRIARADLSARDPARLLPLDPLAANTETWPDAEQTRLLFGLVEVYDRLGDDARVVQMYLRIAARRPADLGVWEALGERAAASGNTVASAEARTKAVALDPTGRSAALFDAWAALAGKDSATANAAADGLVKAFGAAPNRAEACVALARLKQRTGAAADAGRLFERAVRLEPTRFPPAQAYLAHLAASGDDAATAAVLTRLARDYRWSGEPFRRAVSGAVRLVAPDVGKKLVAAARPVVESEPGGLGWLGDAYLAVGAKAEAMVCFEKATTVKTAAPDDWLRLAVRAAQGGSPAAAERAIETARAKLSPAVYFATAAAFAESGIAAKGWAPQLSGAEKRAYAQARLALKLARYERSEAIVLLEGFVADGPPPAADAAWAKRNLAMLLAARGGKDDRRRAKEMLLAAGDAVGETADEKRSAAAVLTALSRHLDGADRKAVLDRATKTLEALVADTRSPRDAFLLAQLYRAGGNREAAVKVLNQLLQADPRNLDYHVVALEELTESANFAAAEPFAERLVTFYPYEFRAVAAVARYECRAGRPEKGLLLAEAYTRTAEANAGDLPAKSARTAELLDELARMPGVRRTETGRKMVRSAVDKYEALVSSRPEAAIAAAGLLAADDRPADAFALIDRYGKSLPARLKAAAGLAVMRAGAASERQVSQVRQWLDEATAAEPESFAVKLNAGEFHALRADYAKAEAAYQAVLDKDPRNVVALNNLAWALAPDPAAAVKALELVDRAIAEIGLTGELLDTRARIRIAAKQHELAEKDSLQALTQEKTPLRMFHLALVKQAQSPSKPDEAREAFKKAKALGLEPNKVHPADLPMYRVFEAGQ